MTTKVQTFLTDIHTHSTFSLDGISPLADMLESAQKMGVAFYGVSEHFDYDLEPDKQDEGFHLIDDKAYFHTARHLQEDYEGVMNVLIGVEFGYTPEKNAHTRYAFIVEKHRPDFIVNSIHTCQGVDYYSQKPFYDKQGNLREKKEVYQEYLELIYQSLFAPYPYDIVGHIGYVARYAPYPDTSIRYCDYAAEFDKILKTIIEKGKMLEINSKGLNGGTTPCRDVIERYFELGGRKISYASDAHDVSAIMHGREKVVEMLKEIGFPHVTVPDKGNYLDLPL